MLSSNESLYYGCKIPPKRFRKFFEKHFIEVEDPEYKILEKDPLFSDISPEYEHYNEHWPGIGVSENKEFRDYLKEYNLSYDINSSDVEITHGEIIIGIEIDRYSVGSECMELLDNTRDEYRSIKPRMSGAKYLSEITRYLPKVLSLIIYNFCLIDDDFFEMLKEHKNELYYTKL